MKTSVDNMDRLFDLYGKYLQTLRSDVVSANYRMGASNPNDFALTTLSRDVFERRVLAPTQDPEHRCRWLRSIVRGHESEFPEMIRTIDEFLQHENGTLRTQNSAA